MKKCADKTFSLLLTKILFITVLKRPFPHHVLRRLVDADVDAAHVFADESEQEHNHAADKEQCGEHAGVANGDFGEHEFFVDHEKACCEPD